MNQEEIKENQEEVNQEEVNQEEVNQEAVDQEEGGGGGPGSASQSERNGSSLLCGAEEQTQRSCDPSSSFGPVSIKMVKGADLRPPGHPQQQK